MVHAKKIYRSSKNSYGYGTIDIDPASSAIANKTVQAPEYYTKENSGLDVDWHGNVWLNPPYAQPLISLFCEKLINSCETINQACVLVNNATETGWGNSLLSGCDAVCFVKGRIKYIDEDGNASGAHRCKGK